MTFFAIAFNLILLSVGGLSYVYAAMINGRIGEFGIFFTMVIWGFLSGMSIYLLIQENTICLQ